MVQSAPNETTVHAKVTGMAADPERDGWVLLDVAVEASATVEGESLPALADGEDVRLVARRSDVEGLGRGDRLVARVQMAGPGDYLVRGVEPALAPEPTDAADPDPAEAPPAKRPTRKRPRSTRESPLSDDR
ncbi:MULTISPECIES: hypothetical protein [Phycicoccus]|jgi:hypothetical protein|uniref:Uncharacterized protein n=1 Tax=Phycicoccus elongatus Lp2 TaxID=1193181 RepID=N0E1Z6_9MICO|nr:MULTISPECIES: hypothetical protein [Phycicoccus]MBK8729522.1 hypothetical protein [Tetrasphaera sp.]CCH69791.1 hypothetical protein BN10_350006 [Phycicoccus elongatus Lp2]HPF76151.1 hypothetical protein [Phycicoccus elongatus]HRV57353.1 hypothetical protein [Phycicoccus sp.]